MRRWFSSNSLGISLVLSIVVGLPPTGCADDASAGSCEPARVLPGATALPADVDAVLAGKCRTCHSDPPEMYAPMPLLTWQHVQAPAPARNDGSAVYERIAVRIHDDKFPMPPTTQPQLTDDERALLDAWLEQCAPPEDAPDAN